MSTLGGRNVTTVQEQKFESFLDAMWPGWKVESKANREMGVRFIELREAFLAGCATYGPLQWTPDRTLN